MKPALNYRTCPINDLTGIVIHEIYQTYFRYGPGLFERVYEVSLAARLRSEGLSVTQQEQIYICDEFVGKVPAFKADLIIDNRVIVEIKSVATLHPVMFTQLKTYLHLTPCEVGFLVNFNCTMLKENVHRMVKDYQPEKHAFNPLHIAQP
jgi:GxxExxY protein